MRVASWGGGDEARAVVDGGRCGGDERFDGVGCLEGAGMDG
jgi:hypothetical protein